MTKNIGERMAAKGYTQVAFAEKANYLQYKKAMEQRGYEVDYIKSSGPTVEQNKFKRNAYYAVTEKKKKSHSTQFDEPFGGSLWN